MGWSQIIVGAVLGLGLVILALLTAGRQWRILSDLRTRSALPEEEKRYFRGQASRAGC